MILLDLGYADKNYLRSLNELALAGRIFTLA